MMIKLSSSSAEDYSKLIEAEDSESISSDDSQTGIKRKTPQFKPSNKFSSKSMLQNKAKVMSQNVSQEEADVLSSLSSVE